MNLKATLTHWQQQQAHQQLRRAQGQLSEAEAADKLAGEGFVPLAEAHGRYRQLAPINLPEQQLEGHLLVVAPPGRGQEAQLAATLYAWPDAAIVIDPSGEQYRRSGRFRQVMIGPVYQVPGYRISLDKYYLLHSPDDAAELYRYLMVTRDAAERPLLDHAYHLFVALGRYAQLKQLNAIQVLLDGAASPPSKVLPALDAEPGTRPWLRRFTNNKPPNLAQQDANTLAAFAAFSRQMRRYQAHFDTICPEQVTKDILPRDWAGRKGTVYIGYDPAALAKLGGLIASIVAALVRYHLSYGQAQRLLVALDENVARHINHLEAWLRLLRDYEVMVRLAVPAATALQENRGPQRQDALLAHFDHQLWYPPNDLTTATAMSALLGVSWSPAGPGSQSQAMMTPAELMALPKDKVLVLTRRERQYRFLAYRVQLDEAETEVKPPPLPPKRPASLRYLMDWPQPQPPRPGPPPDPDEAKRKLAKAANADTSADGAAMSTPKRETWK
ncbi:MAG: type IV secretory system conjugative DNA transfer family protein [Anaerolineales bacterium]|nr:type IV secretory system conjugative DNA transfer family protein [Anaerolineales bacterium]MCB0018486.1 type IV secretory system conjugative DNA transfer family protein [Anaerolineales bacterium]